MASSGSSPIWKSLSLSCLSVPIPFQSWWVTVLFTEGLVLWQTEPLTHERLLGQEHHLIGLFASLPLSSVVCFPFTHRELMPECQTICMFCKRWRWCKCQEVHVVYYLCNTVFTSGLFTLYLVLPYSDLGPEINSKGKSKFKSCRCACEWLGQKEGLSWPGSFFAHDSVLDKPLCPQEAVEERCVCTAASTAKSCGLLSSGKHLFYSARDFSAPWWVIPPQGATAGGRGTHLSASLDWSVHQKG